MFIRETPLRGVSENVSKENNYAVDARPLDFLLPSERLPSSFSAALSFREALAR